MPGNRCYAPTYSNLEEVHSRAPTRHDGYEASVAANDIGAIELIPRFQRERNTPSLIGVCREYP
jgi:hypothetical protein